jgi:predicted metal-dependent phosphoesterase TrpH
LIDLHVHSDASDGLYGPVELVRRAAAAGVSVLSVTDHDTMAATAAVASHGAAQGIETLPGIEITAVLEGRDIHVLGYFLDPASPSLDQFLGGQRADRVRRLRAMAERLSGLGCPIDIDEIAAKAASTPGRTIGRPQLARALVAAGHAASVNEAFNQYLATGRPAFVPRSGASPEEVITLIRAAGGLSSLAHPGLLARDDLIPDLARAGLTAIEVYHPEHPPETQGRYLALAHGLGLGVTGGSDYHGDGTHRVPNLGVVGLPVEAYENFRARRGPHHRPTRA